MKGLHDMDISGCTIGRITDKVLRRSGRKVFPAKSGPYAASGGIVMLSGRNMRTQRKRA